MHKRNKLKAIIAIAVALAFIMPVAVIANNEKTNSQDIVLIELAQYYVAVRSSFLKIPKNSCI